MRREPAMWVALVQAALGLGVAFGLELSPEQVGAILAVVTLVAGLIVRSVVTPVADPRNEAGVRLHPAGLPTAYPVRPDDPS